MSWKKEPPLILSLPTYQLLILLLILFYNVTCFLLIEPLFIVPKLILWLTIICLIHSEPLSNLLDLARVSFLNVFKGQYLG